MFEKSQIRKRTNTKVELEQSYTPKPTTKKSSSYSYWLAVVGCAVMYFGSQAIVHSTSSETELPNGTIENPLKEYAIVNAKIVTMSPHENESDFKWHSALAVKDGKFVYVGDANGLNKKYPNFKKYDLKGMAIQPGMTDAHAHVLGRGYQIIQVDLTNSASTEEVRQRISAHFSKDSKTEWIKGYGWDQTKWPVTSFPTWKDLQFDNEIDNHPLFFKRIDFHAVWVNKFTIDLAIKALPQLADPKFTVDGGEIFRDSQGYPTGVFTDNAQKLVSDLIPKTTKDEARKALVGVQEEMHKYGLTSVHDAAASPFDIEVYQEAVEKNTLNTRVHAMLWCHKAAKYCDDEDVSEGPLANITMPTFNYLNQNKFTFRSVKLFLDGALGSWGAAMLEPYSDDNTKSGTILIDNAMIQKRMRRWAKRGFQVNTHAIGDKANRVSLDQLESLKQHLECYRNKTSIFEQGRHRIEHSQLLHPDDLPRFAKLKVIPSMQPTHATSDMAYAKLRLGEKRLETAYPWKSLLNSGVKHLPFSSDFPVEKVNPLYGFYAATTRLDTKGNSPHGPDGWYPNQKVSPYQALKGFTYDGAYAGFYEDRIGSIEVGKLADFVVLKESWLNLNKDEFFKAPEFKEPSDLAKIQATYFQGQQIYKN